MKTISWLFFLLILSACGQPGPLYLTKDKPAVYVAPPSAPNTETELKKENPPKVSFQEPPQPNQPIKQQQ